MKKITDKTRARLLLEAKERGGHTLVSFARANAKGYIIFGIYFGIALALLGFINAWVAFGYVAFLFSGFLLRDVTWFVAHRRIWPFTDKVINWEMVKKLSDDDIPA